jgi:hypothetical protein
MAGVNSFPLPFRSLRVIRGGNDGSYVIGAMFTAAYSEKATQLAASCEKFGLPYVIHEVPTVHRSISGRGTDDLSYTKANFIRYLLATHKKPVLYLDADCEFKSQPELIDRLARTGCDFAIYNWFADEYNDCFIPIELNPDGGEPPTKDRFYRFLASETFFANKQLKCNGLVQFYGNSVAARAFLARWQRTISVFSGCADDSALSFTFNNLTRRSWLWWQLKVRWLPKTYARISWWIYAKPIINHKDLPTKSSRFVKINDPGGRKPFYLSLMEPKNPVLLFPRDCIIDTEQRMLCKLVDGQISPIEPIELELWL